MSPTKYTLTEEHRAQLAPWTDKWIANAMSTKPMDEEDRAAMRRAIRGLYESAGLKPPPDHRIIFVSSPFCARLAAGIAAAIHHMPNTKLSEMSSVKSLTGDFLHPIMVRISTLIAHSATIDVLQNVGTESHVDHAVNSALSDAFEDAAHDPAAIAAVPRRVDQLTDQAAVCGLVNELARAVTLMSTVEALRQAGTDGTIPNFTNDATKQALTDAFSAHAKEATSDYVVDKTQYAAGWEAPIDPVGYHLVTELEDPVLIQSGLLSNETMNAANEAFEDAAEDACDAAAKNSTQLSQNVLLSTLYAIVNGFTEKAIIDGLNTGAPRLLPNFVDGAVNSALESAVWDASAVAAARQTTMVSDSTARAINLPFEDSLTIEASMAVRLATAYEMPSFDWYQAVHSAIADALDAASTTSEEAINSGADVATALVKTSFDPHIWSALQSTHPLAKEIVDLIASAINDSLHNSTTRAVNEALDAARPDNNSNKYANWYVVPDLYQITERILGPRHAPFGIKCAYEAYRMWQGGNQWSAWVAYASFFRHIVKLPLDYSKWQFWEDAAVHGGPRMMHPEFCIISDRPEVLLVDENNQPHCEDGPFCRWRDGTELYSLHGVRVPAWLVRTAARDLDPAHLYTIDNAEVRREFVRKVGEDRIVQALSSGPVDSRTYTTRDGREHPYELHRLKVADSEWTYLKMRNPSVDLTHFEGVPNTCRTVQEALNFRNNLSPEEISEDGADWIQQGDVILKPEGATRLKPFPAYLT